MPIYVYACEKCNGQIEAIRCVADRERHIECPKCSRELGYSVTASPVMAAPAAQFPGAAGWQR